MSNFDSDNDFCNSICDESNYYEAPTNSYFTPVYSGENQGAHQMQTDDDYWKSPCSSDSPKYIRKFPSNESVIQSSPTSSSYHYVPVYQNDKLGEYICDDYYGSNRVHSGTTTYTCNSSNLPNNNNNHDMNKNLNLVVTTNHMPIVRVIKKRTTANKKERRRTQSINSAYTSLRDHIPNVPADTKLSKIKTLRLATSYISYLIAVLGGEQDSSRGFRAELVPSSRKINAERRAQMKKEIESQIQQQQQKLQEGEVKKRTGWPQSVWGSATRKSIK